MKTYNILFLYSLVYKPQKCLLGGHGMPCQFNHTMTPMVSDFDETWHICFCYRSKEGSKIFLLYLKRFRFGRLLKVAGILQFSLIGKRKLNLFSWKINYIFFIYSPIFMKFFMNILTYVSNSEKNKLNQ